MAFKRKQPNRTLSMGIIYIATIISQGNIFKKFILTGVWIFSFPSVHFRQLSS